MTSALSLWPEPLPGAVWGHWVVLAERLGANFPLARPLLLGIRGVRPNEPETHPLIIRAAYDDCGVLIDHTGTFAPVVFPMSTHAYQTHSKASPDVDGDGLGDVGTILPGRFVLTYRGGKYPVFEVTMPDGGKALPCARDIRHDGTPQQGAYTATDILVHWGYNAPADSDHRSSIGCQCMDGEWLDLLKLRTKVSGGLADYILTTADDAIVLAPRPTSTAESPIA